MNDNPMNGKICMVTGATSGIGLVTARALAEQGATVVIVGRDREKSEAAVKDIKLDSGNQAVEYMLADLANQSDIRKLAEQFKRKYDRLHVLVNNAGAIFMSRQQSADGIEMTFALNHLNYFLLTNQLLDTLKASAPARIVNVSSTAHERAIINLDDLEGKQKYSGFQAYGQSKLANIMFTYELARRLKGTGVTANALHPGVVKTNFAANNWGWWGRVLRRLFDLISIDVEEGAQTSIYLATSPEVEGITGKYFVEKKIAPSSQVSYNQKAAQQLWQLSVEMTGLEAPRAASK